MAGAYTYDVATYDAGIYDGVPGALYVDLFLNGAWVDITGYVRCQDQVVIRRGRADEASEPQATTCSLTLDNRDGRFTPKNTAGAFYPYLGRNTPMRVFVRLDDGSANVRFCGYVSEWPPSWDFSGREATVSIVGNGVRRRLQQHQNAFRSPYRRGTFGTTLIGYWPMEDGTQATSFAAANDVVSGVSKGTFTGNAVAPGSDTRFVCSDALASMGDFSSYIFPVKGYTASAAGQQIRMLFYCTNTSGSITWVLQVPTTGDYLYELDYTPNTDTYQLFWSSMATGAAVGNSGAINLGDGKGSQVRLSLKLKQNGANVDYVVETLKRGNTTGSTFSGTAGAATLGLINKVKIFNGTGLTSVVGHLTVDNQQTAITDMGTVLDAFAGETAAARVTRLATEEGQTITVVNSRNSTELLGQQTESTFLSLFDEAAFSDGGLSTEAPDSFGLVFRARSDMYSRTPVVTMTYGSSPLRGLVAADDDQNTLNDVTVARINGSSSRYTVSTGNLGTVVAGTYADQVDVSLYEDTETLPQAQWRAAVGTVDQSRWPLISYDASLATTAAERTAVAAMREGDTLQLSSLPAFAGPSSAKVIVLGWTEIVDNGVWRFEINAIPGPPYSDVLVLDSATLGVLDSNRLGL